MAKQLTVGELRKALEGVPDDANVSVQKFQGGKAPATGFTVEDPSVDEFFSNREFVIGI